MRILLYGVIVILSFVNMCFAVQQEEWNMSYSKFDQNRGQTEMSDREDDTILNEQAMKSRSYKYLKNRFDKYYKKEYSNTRGGLRLGPIYSVWFNNLAPDDNDRSLNEQSRDYQNLRGQYSSVRDFSDFQRRNTDACEGSCNNKYTVPHTVFLSDGNGGSITLEQGEKLQESQCFDNFITYLIKNKKSYNQDAFEEWKNMEGNGRYVNSNVPKDKRTIFEDAGISTFDDYYNKVNSFDYTTDLGHEKVWRLQTAINIIGCDSIMADGKLGNYTIKSFCECNKIEHKCIDVIEKSNEIGNFHTKQHEPLSLLGNGGICQSKLYKDMSKLSQVADPGVDKVDLYCQLSEHIPDLSLVKETAGAFCCTNGLEAEEITYKGEKIMSCCIEAIPENIKNCDNKDEIIGGKCGPIGEDSVKYCTQKVGDTDETIQIPFCPCESGGDTEVTQEGDEIITDCGCIEDPNETCLPGEFYKMVDGAPEKIQGVEILKCGAVSDVEATHCKSKETEEIIEICPCTNNGTDEAWKRDTVDDDFECPCVKTEEGLEKCTNIPTEEESTCGPGTNYETCETDEGNTYPICPCPTEDGEEGTWQYGNGKWQCPDCEEGEKYDFEKEKCVCDPNQQCCGIELNTQVPRIGDCIEFGNTNDKDRVYTDKYGQGNTTITVNILNAFPLLMRALSKQALTIFLLFCFGGLIYAGIRMAMGDPSEAKKWISRIIIGVALVGASGVILHMINPNFFM